MCKKDRTKDWGLIFNTFKWALPFYRHFWSCESSVLICTGLRSLSNECINNYTYLIVCKRQAIQRSLKKSVSEKERKRTRSTDLRSFPNECINNVTILSFTNEKLFNAR